MVAAWAAHALQRPEAEGGGSKKGDGLWFQIGGAGTFLVDASEKNRRFLNPSVVHRLCAFDGVRAVLTPCTGPHRYKRLWAF